MFKANPIDPLALAPGIAVAQLDPPRRRTLGPYIFQRALHRIVLAVHAPRFPPAHEAEIEENRVVKRRWRVRPRVRSSRTGGGGEDCCSSESPPHQAPN